MTSVAVVVPAYNAGPDFGANLVRFADYFAPYRRAYEFSYVIVDDASTDETLNACEAFARYRRNVIVIPHERRCGLGRALRTAFNRVRAEYTIVLDSGVTYAAAAAMELLEALERTGADVAVASPYMRGAHRKPGPVVRSLYERAANRWLCAVTHGRCASFTCILRAYRTQFLKRLAFTSDGARAIPELLFAAIRAGGRIVEQPTRKDWHISALNSAPPPSQLAFTQEG
jgi:glycosyltransferase involved in cell wall biosynthesis